MKKIILLFAVILSAAVTANAQKGGYKQNDNLLNIGIGVNSYYSGGIPISASFEKGITKEISVGANVDYLSYKYSYSAGYYDKFTAIYFGVRGSYHINELLKLDNEKIDLYGGLTLGYRSFTWSDNYSGSGLSGSYDSGIYLGAYIGGKYYFNPKIGAFVELGAIGSTNARLGVAFKF